MADNLGYTPGSGATVATDDVGGVHYQKMKLAFGANDSATDVSATNPFPVTNQDCVSLLSTTVSAPGVGSSIDTLGYGAVVVQISGTWQGTGYFEASNDGVVWDAVLVFSRDNLSLQDVVTSNGLYTIRPSGRYLRYVCTNITGAATVNALGRAAEGVNAADLLSLAMDKANNTPLFVSPVGQSSLPFAQDQVTGAAQVSNASQTFSGRLDCSRIGNVIFDVACDGYATAFVTNPGGTGIGGFIVEGLYPGGWSYVWGVGIYSPTVVLITSTGQSASAHNPASYMLGGASRVRVRCSSAGAGSVAFISMMLSTVPVMPISSVSFGSAPSVQVAAGTAAIGDVGVQYRANATGAATTYKFTSAASTNAALILTGARRLIGWNLTNTTASTKYFRIHNKATAPVAGTDSPLFIIAIPPNATINYDLPGGIAIALGLGVMCTGAVADLDTTATAVGDVVGALFYA